MMGWFFFFLVKGERIIRSVLIAWLRMGWLIVCNGVGSDNNLQQKLGRSFGLFQVKQDKLNNVVAIHNFACNSSRLW